MKRITTAILVTAVALGAVSCKKDLVGEGPVTSQTRGVANFTAVDLQMNGNVYYTKSSEKKIQITAKQSIHDILETNVTDNRLVIRYRNGKTYDADESIRINIYSPEISSLVLNTSGSIYVMSDIQSPSLYLRSSGSGNIFLQKVFSNQLDVDCTQSGLITALGGSTINEKLKSDGSGKIDLSALSAKSAIVRTIGSGDIKVKATDRLDVTIDGSGSVYFSGSPQISTHISGTGHLVRF